MNRRTLVSKRETRQRLAALPVVEKLRLLDALREREISIGRKLADGVTARPAGEAEATKE